MRRALLVLLIGVCGCRKHTYTPPTVHQGIPEPSANDIESVVYLVGDAGEATMEHSPILRVLRQDVEQWSAAINRDGEVVVLYLGDNVYPRGMRDRSDIGWAEDSTRLQSQFEVVAGANARRYHAKAVFVPGNHDWGHMPGPPGVARVRNQQEFIQRRSKGFYAELLPKAGETGPALLDIGKKVRLLLLDTAWWLLEADYSAKTAFLKRLDNEFASADGRAVMIAAHHPWTTGSAHGGLIPFWKGIGVQWLMNRSGALLQDLNSLPYRDLLDQSRKIFEQRGSPLLSIGGHDHTLQVIKGMSPTDPKFIAVSGAGSKSSDVGDTDGTVFKTPGPGFMRLTTLKNGAIDLFVYGANPEFRNCTRPDPAAQTACMRAGPSEFHLVYSVRIKEP